MIAISHILEDGQLWGRKRSLNNFLLLVNNVNSSNKPKIAPDRMDAVYCYCLVQ